MMGTSRPHWAAPTAVIAVLAATACPGPPAPVKLEPTAVPPTFIAVAPGITQKSAQFLTGSMVFLRVKDAATGLRVPRAAIGIHGPTLAGGMSGATFDLSFGPMAAATYKLVVSAPGYVTASQDLAVAPRAQAGQKTADTNVEIKLQPGSQTISGRVVDDRDGAPLAGARIMAGANVAYTGTDGAFRLEGLGSGSQAVTVRKTGFSKYSSTLKPGDAGTLRLGFSGLTINFANASTVFGNQTAVSALSSLQATLRAAGATVKENDPSGASIQVLAAPGSDVAARAVELKQFVRDGGKLVVMGEWGGLAGYSPEAAEAILHDAGLSLNPDLVRSGRNAGKADWPLASALAPWPYPSAEVGLFESATVLAVPPAQAVLRAVSGYRIAAASSQDPVMAAVAPYGEGLIAAVGDTSAFTDTNTTGTGPDLGYKDNRSYVVNLILW
ncbi:MAG: carboxypeptidase regulatory-like domain-containing protein [Candidatus Sericytochromatia bacterium]|uniref:Carboxypeptidase regulatory-like domain-containing protein n=1 Tax=Candidatus Tanganyikabacteria bacterium TaxID=2961651 RepID=A0A937X2F6_9BACT|nr:carboxypeptidase regulatory-like domain-containing protein [Candidatus Tanganyikabacteria bacterium]